MLPIKENFQGGRTRISKRASVHGRTYYHEKGRFAAEVCVSYIRSAGDVPARNVYFRVLPRLPHRACDIDISRYRLVY